MLQKRTVRGSLESKMCVRDGCLCREGQVARLGTGKKVKLLCGPGKDTVIQ